ncbi:MAG: hypothetical protein UY23_C0001G0049 [Candidatus Jorgensenbacteria bacterium GW2011_GWA1_48_11]|uniref:Uncharacterized protein n=1 Tax=Candidatus Jorgensenbacteria bacterium GW2011_GWA1_48_11 TaxID=1618660 RepID=A0A0G1WM77_9BACT|nr:MAG: hypothetical protein UY23_C0001G0049 [Candidatus Jorgensenbacteria bacterium GW2011_GWA1_48_11]KKW11937.1 MAG: hypothetical protein UY51_C0005G0179 [Candidatus Jorgensenbacteria bacterium GW2011_GWB1_49_9]
MTNEKPFKEPSPEGLDEQIMALLGRLYERYAGDEIFEKLSPEIIEEWYLVETEADTGKDRQAAKEKLEAFIRKLEGLNL